MKKYTGKSGEVIDAISHGQEIECRNIEYAEIELPQAKNRLVKTVLETLRLEAKKHHLIQEMIAESIKEDSVNLSPDELQEFSTHVNKYLEAEGKALSFAKQALEKSNLPVPHYLLSYLVADLKMQNGLLTRFEDELKAASVPTSVSSRTVAAHGTS